MANEITHDFEGDMEDTVEFTPDFDLADDAEQDAELAEVYDHRRGDISDLQYQQLHEVLTSAYNQAAFGKGKERHADDEPFERQGICRRAQMFPGSALAQAHKKIEESTRLDGEAKVRELLGAINYIAAEIVAMRSAK